MREAARHSFVGQLRQRVDTALHEMPRWDLAGQVVASMAEDLSVKCGLDIVSSDEGPAPVGKGMPLEAGRARVDFRRRDGYLYQLRNCGVLLRHQTLTRDKVCDIYVFRARYSVWSELRHEVLARCIDYVCVNGLGTACQLRFSISYQNFPIFRSVLGLIYTY